MIPALALVEAAMFSLGTFDKDCLHFAIRIAPPMLSLRELAEALDVAGLWRLLQYKNELASRRF